MFLYFVIQVAMVNNSLEILPPNSFDSVRIPNEQTPDQRTTSYSKVRNSSTIENSSMWNSIFYIYIKGGTPTLKVPTVPFLEFCEGGKSRDVLQHVREQELLIHCTYKKSNSMF